MLRLNRGAYFESLDKFVGMFGSELLFGSELKSLTTHPSFEKKLSHPAMSELFEFGYIPAPRSIYENVRKLLPGEILTARYLNDSLATETRRYWSAQQAVQNGINTPYEGDFLEAQSDLTDLLSDAVKIRMISDVPLGAFLSGGIDSSMIVALMQRQSSSRIKTFSIGFHEAEYNEATHARVVAEHLGTEHTELYVAMQDALKVIPLLPQIFDEPFADSSQIPTYLVSKLCREHVTVSLSGDGGDELFGGYDRYQWAKRIHKTLRFIPHSLRTAGAQIINGVTRKLTGNVVNRAKTFSRLLPCKTVDEFYHQMMKRWEPSDLLINNHLGDEKEKFCESKQISEDVFLMELMGHDMAHYLPDDILVKVDRASMAVSLEARAPFLDHRIVEFACRLPIQHKLVGAIGKKILRSVLYNFVPRKLVERPKMGFRVPVSRWLRGELQSWADSLLHPKRLEKQGLLQSALLLNRWKEHLAGSNRWEDHIWSVLMFQSWMDAQHL